MTNEELALQVQEGNTAALEQLAQQNSGLMRRAAYRLFILCGGPENNTGMEYADALQIVFLGLYGAAMAYDPAKGFMLSSYLWRQTQRAYRDQYRRQEKDPLASADSIDREISGEAETLVLDNIPDESAAAAFEDCEQVMFARQARTAIDEAMQRLPDNLREAVQSVYLDGGGVADYARENVCSSQNIETIIRRAFRQLRRCRELREYGELYRTANALRGTGLKSFRNNGASVVERLNEEHYANERLAALLNRARFFETL